MHFLEVLKQRLQRLEGVANIEPSEALYDFIADAMIRVSWTRSVEKRKRFATIVAKQVSQTRQWEEAQDALKILGELSDAHMDVLVAATDAPISGPPFDGLRVVTLAERPHGQTTVLTKMLPRYPDVALKRTCADLLSRGLLIDEGVGRIDTKAMEYFVASDIAFWFIDWVLE